MIPDRPPVEPNPGLIALASRSSRTASTKYWRYGYTHVTSYTTAYEHSSEYLGWSLANHSEWTNYFPDWFPDEGIGTGQFRFNGPFGVGCKSGSIAIDFFGDGSHPVFKYYGGYYGC